MPASCRYRATPVHSGPRNGRSDARYAKLCLWMRCLHVRIFEDRKHDAIARVVPSWTGWRRLARLQPVHAVRPLQQWPSEVARAFYSIGCLPKCLCDRGHKEAAVIAIEGDPKRVAKSPSPNFLFPRSGRKWVVARNCVTGKSSIDVDTKDLAKQRLGVLCETVPGQRLRRNFEGLPKNRLADAMRYAAVAKADVEKPVGAEGEGAAIVFAAGPVDLQQNPLRGSVDFRQVARVSAELGHSAGMVPALGRGRAQGRRIGRKHAAVARELRVQGKAQQTALLEVLLERQQSWPQIEKRLGFQSAVRAKHLYNAILLDDEFSSAAVGGLLQMQRRRQTFRNRFQHQILCRGGRSATQHGEHHDTDNRDLDKSRYSGNKPRPPMAACMRSLGSAALFASGG